ncbi:MAG: UDP-glucose 4-epimerase GalE [Anaeroplasmataceae bacterium]
MKTILVPGGAGYIGSHTCVELLNKGYEVIIYDNLSNSKKEVINRIEKITNKRPLFIEGDVLDYNKLIDVFTKYKIDAVINFSGLKAVGESVKNPLTYYHTNITGALNLLNVMKEYNCFNFIFSSSATVYGDPEKLPLTENSNVGNTTNPYGTTKLYIEKILQDLYISDNRFNLCILRYFNPIGAHPSSLIGEDPNGIPTNLVPFITQTAIGKREYLQIFGNDYNTKDGTGVRDYVHVVDLAVGHVLALEKLFKNPGLVTYNLGTGKGYSVLDVLKAIEKVSGKKIEYKILPRRSGDVAACYSDASKALKELNFTCKYDLDDMASTSWNWQKNNPNGYE